MRSLGHKPLLSLLAAVLAAAALDPPYICRMNEVDESGGRHFIVMEYIEGRSLKDRLEQGPLPLEEALPIAIEAAEALEAAITGQETKKNYLFICLNEFPEICRKKHGMTFDLKAVEKKVRRGLRRENRADLQRPPEGHDRRQSVLTELMAPVVEGRELPNTICDSICRACSPDIAAVIERIQKLKL